MMRRNGESWLISDIYLDGAISEVATRRSEFATILKNDGIDGLIAALNRKADILTRPRLKHFSCLHSDRPLRYLRSEEVVFRWDAGNPHDEATRRSSRFGAAVCPRV
jgi:hypothetical protein